mmetsp:Transcript_37569/g.99873  ORF Transcript_37569/g.99873 Transcript_37569/m.99873 type:complete len:231 (-) Transcript_37569:400-1092(-)
MSLIDIRDTFQRETDRQLAKLVTPNGEQPPRVSPGERQQLETLRDLSSEMTEGILRRLADDPAWRSALESDAAQLEREAAACDPQDARVRELEALFAQRKAEEASYQQELAKKIQDRFKLILNMQDFEASKGHRHIPAEMEDMCRDVIAKLERIGEGVAATKRRAEVLDHMQLNIARVDAQQRQVPNPIEVGLAGTHDREEGEEEAALLRAIAQGEAECKRLRSHLSDPR